MDIDIDGLTIGQARAIVAQLGGRARRVPVPFRERDVIVRSSGGVYFGRLVACVGTYGRLIDGRHIRTWKSPSSGKAISCGDLAIVGAGTGTSITRPVPTELPTIYAIYDCTAEASALLRALPCAD